MKLLIMTDREIMEERGIQRMKLVREDGSEVKEGDTLTDFRGDKHTFISLTRGGRRVCVRQKGAAFLAEYFPSVFPGVGVEEGISREETETS